MPEFVAAYTRTVSKTTSSFRKSSLRAAARWVRFALTDLRDVITLRRDALTPPARLVARVGGHDFRQVGAEFQAIFVAHAGLEPTDRVLDIGCGAGRMAVPLTRYLQAPGSYAGFDIDAEAIAWCRRAITPRFPAFAFQHADVRNEEYNPEGSLGGASFVFPYPGEAFDFAIAASLFTHLLAEDLDHYLAETARVLTPGGTLVATAFLLDGEARALQQAGRSDIVFAASDAPWAFRDPGTPAAAVAYDEEWLLARLGGHDFSLAHPVSKGLWSGRPGGLTYQDVLIARKNARPA